MDELVKRFRSLAIGRRALWRATVSAVVVITAWNPAPARAIFDDGVLTSFELQLLGLSARPEPESQVVPRNTPTGIRVAIELGSSTADVSELLSLLPSGLEIAAELVGPGIDAPFQLRGSPGALLPIPPLVERGSYLVRDIRLELDGELLVRAHPDSANVEVIERVLVTRVTTRPLEAEEIRQKGIIFGDENFKAFNFTLALKLDSRPVNIDFPVVFDANDVLVTTRSTASIDLQGVGGGVPLVNAQFQPVLLKMKLPEARDYGLDDSVPDVSIPGLLVIPGDVGFLNQFFSAILVVANGAPLGSGLAVRDLEGTIRLPPGLDGVAGTLDDPLAVAATESGVAHTLPIVDLGSDGILGTGDAADLFFPGEQGQAEYLLEGRKEGFHSIDFDITGTLEGLPVGPVEITGTARGGVVVRNPYFNVTFSAPRTVRQFEPFTLFVNVTNTSEATANFVHVTLNTLQLSGADLEGPETQTVTTLLAGDSETLRFRFTPRVTGEVTASYLELDPDAGGDSDGRLMFTLGVGERGVPLSPDTLVLPTSVEALPSNVVDQALRVLGQAWSLATAPEGTVPEGVVRVSKQTVVDRAVELAEAGLRVQLGEDPASSLASLVFTWVLSRDEGFDQLLRGTDAGEAFQAAIGAAIATADPIAVFHENLSSRWTSRPPHLMVSAGDGISTAPVIWEVIAADAGALNVDGAGENLFSSDLAYAGYLPLSDPTGTGRGAVFVDAAQSRRYDVRWTATGEGHLDLSLSLPRSDGSIGLHEFAGVPVGAGAAGRVVVDLLVPSPVSTMSIDTDGDGLFETSVDAAPERVLSASDPSFISANVIGPETLSGADSFGRAVALLFDRELRPEEADRPENYGVEANEVLSARTQLSGRLVFLFLEKPAGNLVERDITVSGLYDTTGLPMFPRTMALGSRMVPPASVGGIVSGRVLDAAGVPIEGAQVVYLNSVARGASTVGVAQQFTGSEGRYQFDWVRRADFGPFVIQAFDPATGGFQERSTSIRTDGERLVVDLVMRGRGGVTGVVTDLSGDPVPGARVLVTSDVDPANWALVESGGDGRYTATDIIVGPVSVKAVSGVSSGLASGNLQRAGIFTAVDVTINTGVGTVVSRVLEIDGADVTKPVPRARVFFLVPTGDGYELVAGSGDTDENGLIVFEDVPTGPFRIAAFDLVRGIQASKTGELIVNGADVVVNGCPGGECQVLFIEEAVGNITGQVRLASGEPAVGALVRAGGLQAITQVDGSFSIESVATGSHRVSAELGRGRHASATVSIVAGETTPVSLTLPGLGSVVVTLLDTDGSPLPGRTVIRVLSACSGLPRVTDASGVAVFDDVPIGRSLFKSLRDDDVAEGYATVQRDGETASIALRFGGFGTVRGTVVDAGDDPIEGADVILGARVPSAEYCTMLRNTRARQVKTGPDGTFQFDDVPVGAVYVSASSFFLPIPAAASANLLHHGDLQDFTLRLTSNIAGELGGTVYLSDGTTAAGGGVQVTISGGRPDVTVHTDAAGHYSFAKIFPAGRYTLVAADPLTGKLAKEWVFLQADQDLTADMRLLGQGTVNVTVLDGGGVPIEDAFVEIRGARYPFFQSAGAITDSDGGSIRFERVPEGSFSVTASDNEGRGGRAYGALVEDGSTVDVTVNVTVTGTVTGTFKTPDGTTPIPNAEVTLRQGTGRFLGSTVTSSDPAALGTFRFDFVPAGNVLVTAMDPLTGRLGETSGLIETQDQWLDLEILQLGAGTLSGTVSSGGDPVAAAEVRLVSSTGLSRAVPNLRANATTDGVGAFLFDGVPVGHFELTATVPGLLLVGTETGFIDTDGEVLDEIAIELTPSGTLTGDVLRPDGATPVPAAELTVRPVTGTLRTDSDASGRYETAFVPAGVFDIEARESGGPDAGIAAGELAESETLEVDVVFHGTGTVEGVARDFDDTPLTTGTVRLTRSAPFARDESATVAPDGTFRFFGIPVGTYNLSLSVPGEVRRGTASGEIETDGDVDSVTVELADAGFVTGLVVKEEDGVTPAPNTAIEVRGSGFMLSVLTGPDGRFEVKGVPLGSFEVWAEDPVTDGLARSAGDLSTAGETADVGTLVLDTQPIEVEWISPAPGSTVPPDTPIVLRFSDPTDFPNTIGRFYVRSGGVNLSGHTAVSPDGLELTFTPLVGAAPAFPPSSTIDVFLNGAIADRFRRRMGEHFESSFQTGAAVVTGTVLDGSLPAAGVNVTLTSTGGGQTTPTDAAGSYRVENVPPGLIVVQAVHPGDGRGSSSSRTLAATDGLVKVDLALGFIGGVSGQVLEHDGSASAAGLEVVVSSSSGTLATTTTAPDGSYAFTNIPVGPVVVDVTNLVTADRGRTTGTVSTGGSITLDVAMEGVGSLRLFVRDHADAVVTSATTRVSYEALPIYKPTPVFRYIDNVVAEPDGSYWFPYVPAGAFDVYASDPVSGLAASGSGAIVPGEDHVLDIHLEAAGAIRVVVRAPDGSTPVEGADVSVRRWNYLFAHEEAVSDASGEARFENLPVAWGPYIIEVELGGRLRARVRDVATTLGGETTVEVALVGLGSVSGQVIPPEGESLSSNVRVDLQSLASEVGGLLRDWDAADGAYLITDVPVGTFTVTGHDGFNGFQGEAFGTIASDGENVVVDIELQDNGITFSAFGNRLYDGNYASYRIRQDGRLQADNDTLIDFEGDALNLEVAVNGGAPTPFTGLATGFEEESGRELVTSPQDVDGIRVRRKIFVAKDGYFARYLEIFENPGAADVTVTATLRSHLTSESAIHGDVELIASSSGDAFAEAGDVWIVADDGKNEDPFDGANTGAFATAFVLAGETSLAPSVMELSGSGIDSSLDVGYDVTVPAGGRAIVMHFTSQLSFRDSAEAAASRLRQLPPEALVGIGPDEIAAIANFSVPEDGVSDVEALPPLDGKLYGQLLAHDGVTGVGYSTGAPNFEVRFESDQIFYRRVRKLNADDFGRFGLETKFTTSTHVVIPRTGFTIASSRTVGGSTVAATASSDFVSRSFLGRAQGVEASASSVLSELFGPEEVVDGNPMSDWRAAAGVTSATLDLAFPVDVGVDEVRILPHSAASLDQVQIDLLGDAGQILDSRSAAFPAPQGELTVAFEPVSGVRTVVFRFDGDVLRVGEIEVYGTTSTDLGSALQDLVFAGSAGVRVQATRPSGEGLASNVFGRSAPPSAVQVVNKPTGPDGVFALIAPLPVDVGPIDFTLTATHAAVGHTFLKATGQAALSPDTTTVLDVVYPETAPITGQVTTSTGSAASGVSVALFPSSGPGISQITDASGIVTFGSLPADTYLLRLLANGRFLYSPPIELAPPSSHVESLQIPTFGSIDLTILVETAAGAPVQPVATWLTVVDVLGARNFTTNASGQKTIPGVAGAFTIQVPHPADAANVTTEPGAITTDGQILPVTVVIPALGMVTGAVTYADGAPAPNAVIELSGAGVTPKMGAANASGVYTIHDVEALRPFGVVARHPAANRSHVLAIASGELAANGASATVNVTLPGTGTVEVQVVELDGTTPIPGAAIAILDGFSTDFRAEGTTGADGTRATAIVPEGSFTVRAELLGVEIGTATGEVPGGSVGTVVSVTIMPPPDASVAGSVLAADGTTPVPGALVRLLEDDGITEIASVGADAAGAYRFAYVLPVGDTAVVRAELPGDSSVSAETSVTASTEGETIEADLVLPARTVTGRVLDSDGLTPVSDASVTAVSDGGYGRASGTSAADGRFTMIGLAAGSYELVATDPDGLTGFATVDLSAGDDTVEKDVVLPAFGTVMGAVVDAGGAPPAGVEDGEVALSNANLDAPRTVSPDSYGFYHFDRVAEGTFTVVYDDASSRLSGATTSFVAAGASLGEVTNIARAYGVSVAASSQYSAAYAPTKVVDGNLNTSWFTALGDAAHLGSSPFLEVIFPADATVTEIRMFGNRSYATGHDFFSGIFQLYHESGTVLFDSGVVLLPGPERDIVLTVPQVSGVRRVRFTGTDDEGNDPGFAEIEIYGELSVTNLAFEAGATANASSSYYYGYSGLARAVDGNLNTSWFTSANDAVNRGGSPFYEIVLPRSYVVTEIQMYGNRQSANGYDFFEGRFELFDETGGVRFDSGIVPLPAPVRDVVVPVPDAGGVVRVRFTPTADESATPGFAELVVFGRVDDPDAPAADIALPETGSVSGQLLASDGSPAAPSGGTAPIDVRSTDRESRDGVVSTGGSVDGAGLYHVTGVAEGDITVSVIDSGQAGVASANVQAGLEASAVELRLGTAEALPFELGLPGAKRHLVRPDGSVEGELDASGVPVELGAVSVNGKLYAPQNAAGAELSGRQIVLGPVRMSGLDHTRKVFVPEGGAFVRTIDILENPHDFDVEATVRLDGVLRVSNLATSSGDAAFDRTDRYLGGEVDTGIGLAVVFAGAGAVRAPDAPAADGDTYALTWRKLIVPAGGRVILINFAVQADTRAGALAEAAALFALTDPNATADLSPAEKADVINFDIP